MSRGVVMMQNEGMMNYCCQAWWSYKFLLAVESVSVHTVCCGFVSPDPCLIRVEGSLKINEEDVRVDPINGKLQRRIFATIQHGAHQLLSHDGMHYSHVYPIPWTSCGTEFNIKPKVCE